MNQEIHMQQCPFCEEMIQDGALKCRYCKEWLAPRNEASSMQDHNASLHPQLSSLLKSAREKMGTVVRRLEGLEVDERPFLLKAMEKYFTTAQIHDMQKWAIEQRLDYLPLLALALQQHSVEALESLLAIYGLD